MTPRIYDLTDRRLKQVEAQWNASGKLDEGQIAFLIGLAKVFVSNAGVNAAHKRLHQESAATGAQIFQPAPSDAPFATERAAAHEDGDFEEIESLRILVSQLRSFFPQATPRQSEEIGNYLLRALWLGAGKPADVVFGSMAADQKPKLRLV